MDLPLIAGIIGTTILVLTFILNENHKLTVDDLIFDILHFIGSILLIIYALQTEILIFVLLNAIAALVSLRDIIKGLLGKPRTKVRTALIRQKRSNKPNFMQKIFNKKPNREN